MLRPAIAVCRKKAVAGTGAPVPGKTIAAAARAKGGESKGGDRQGRPAGTAASRRMRV